MISAEEALYQSCYCEENVYKLIEKIDDKNGIFAIIISNDCKMIPLWKQKAAKSINGHVLWDYHVIAIEKEKNGSKVYDLDSTLEWSCDFLEYWEKTMNLAEMAQRDTKFRRKFRVIPGENYISLLSSDRSHMLSKNGVYLKPPPEWPLINSHKPSNLMELIRMSEQIENTTVMDEPELFQLFSK